MMGDTPETLLRLGYQARREDRLADAKAHFSDAVDLCREAGDSGMLARAFCGLGQIESDLHETSDALSHYEEAAAIYRTLNDPLVLAHTVRHVADILRRQGRPAQAAPCYIEALAIYRSNGQAPPLDLANAIRGYALLKGDAGESEEARELWQEAGHLYAAVGVEAGAAEARRRLSL